MLDAYLNYPNSRVTAHGGRCGHIQQARKSGQRCVILSRSTIGTELQRFVDREYTFGAQAATNDMWLTVDFDDLEFEAAVVHHVHRLLGVRYKRFRDCRVEWHCR